jgi:hypothetical protein
MIVSTLTVEHIVVHGTSPKQNKIEKIMRCPTIKSPILLHGKGYFFLQEKYFVFIV